ncbi:MAG TPA: TylF/MycF/NovP-related O-methyltransferase [Candidatus Saccharimonadales bacterium]|nr:TylF/MycF/NovP-related O-methyltransferase [Candidatus Saccharimonadales bacterium]
MITPELLKKYPLLSDQITHSELNVVLRECEKILIAKEAGAIVEFGCFSGTTSVFIRRLLDAYKDARAFHVYDSFAGLPPKAPQDHSAVGVDFTGGKLTVSKRQFIKNFERAQLRPPIIHKAWFNELQDADLPRPIAFAFLDGDFYESILTSLQLVWPRRSPHGVILLHDYNRETLPGVARAVQDFFATHGPAPRIVVESQVAILRY